jgi:hypothetical protein
MNYKQMTAPCGLDCLNCIGYLANEDQKLIPVIAEDLNITKLFNLCLIKKLGLETWAEEKAKDIKETYFNGIWKL